MRTLIAALLTLTLAGHADAAPAERIVSIGGAVTEILYAIGAEDRIVGSDTTSIYPPAAAQTPKVGYMRALSAEGILSLKPDLVILTDEAGPPPVLQQLRAVGVDMLVLPAARSVNDVQTNVTEIAGRLGQETAGRAVNAKIEDAGQELSRRVAAMNGAPRVMFILNHGGGSPMVSGTGTAADAIIGLAGGRNAVQGYEGYKPLTPEAAVRLKPDFILVTSSGLENAGGLEGFLNIPGIGLTEAARSRRIIAMDALYLLGFGPRTAEAASTLQRQLAAE